MKDHYSHWHTAGAFLTGYINYQKKIAAGEDEISEPTGLTELDGILGVGLHSQDLIFLAARPSMGKSALAMNFARHIVMNEEKPVAYFSLEMERNAFFHRLLSSITGISSVKIRLPQLLSDKEWISLADGVKKIEHAQLYLDFTSIITPQEIYDRVLELSSTMKLGLVVVDFFQLLNIDTTYDSIKNACKVFKHMAIRSHVPVVLLSQLNRKIDGRTSKWPILSDLRGAGAIEEIADVILFLYRDELYNPGTRDKGIAEIIVAKQKEGPTGMVRVKWVPEHLTFLDLS